MADFSVNSSSFFICDVTGQAAAEASGRRNGSPRSHRKSFDPAVTADENDMGKPKQSKLQLLDDLLQQVKITMSQCVGTSPCVCTHAM